MSNIAAILPNGRTCFYDANGVPLVNGTVAFYIPNTSTPKNTWQDPTQNTLNTNPVSLDSLGSALIYGFGQYRQLVKDSLGNTIWDQLTADPLYPLETQTSPTSGGTTVISYLPPGGVVRTLYSKLAEQVSVKDFGAVGDGSTDDTNALQNALTYIASNGTQLYFPAGNYRIINALSVTFSGTSDLQTNRPNIRGAGSGSSRILWDGLNTPSIYMLTIQRTDSSDNAGLHALSIIEGVGFSPINSGKNYFVSGLYLSKWAYLDMRDIYCHRLNIGMYLDQIISSTFLKLVQANCNYGLQSVGAPTSSNSAVYANNANLFLGCTIGGNNIGGFSYIDGSFTFLGGSVESNGQGGTAGTGYGAYVSNTAAASPFVCVFEGVYFEANGTTGNPGSNASTADIWINHDNLNDNASYAVQNCTFIQLAANYAPIGIYLNDVATTACIFSLIGNHFTGYGYTPSSSRPYVKINDGGGGLTNIALNSKGNYYNQSSQNPDFAAGTAYYTGLDYHIGALVYPSVQQSIANNTTTALNFSTVVYNLYSIFDAGSPTRLTVPLNAHHVKITGNIRFASISTADAELIVLLHLNGSASFEGNARFSQQTGASAGVYEMNIVSPILAVSAGDYFELCVLQNTGGAVNTDSTFTSQWFSMEIIN